MVTAQTHPQLRWNRLQAMLPNGRPINYPHVVFTTYPIPNGRVQIVAYDERNPAHRYEYQCNNPNMAMTRVIYWATQHAPLHPR